MTPIVLTLIQAVILLLLYLFVARAVRTVLRDLRAANEPPPVPSQAAGPAPAPREGGGARAQPRELVVHSPDGRSRVVSLNSTGDIVLGRGSDTTVALGDTYASERHARIYRDRGEWVVADLGSTNGTFLNRARVTRPTRIAPGDQLGMGQTTVEVRS